MAAVGTPAGALAVFGAALTCLGLAVLAFFLALLIARSLVRLTGRVARGVKACFIRKDGAENE